MTLRRWHKSRRNQLVLISTATLCLLYYLFLYDSLYSEPDLDLTRRYIENRLKEALKEDKGSGCQIPKLDPFAREVMQFDKTLPKVVCNGKDWVKCHLSNCNVLEDILATVNDVKCTYRDIIYESDSHYYLGPSITVLQGETYILNKSDHVKIHCEGKRKKDSHLLSWSGHAAGFRSSVHPKPPPPGREDSLNILILGFDSTSHNGFIRKMPRSYQMLTEEIQATVLHGYNILGDGTPAALFPILTGKNELEMPDVRRSKNSNTLDSMPFIFHKLKEYGYRTSYFEDMPWVGTFQYRFNGFKRQPADHYLRAFYMEESSGGRRFWSGKTKYCVGDTPQYRLMLNLTEQFFQLDGKKYCFTFIADITHDNFNMISTADDDLVEFLKAFIAQGRNDDTLLMVMGDHGPRFADVRDTLQGKLEERLPLMAVLLPRKLKRSRPEAQWALDTNAHRLTTPHDIYATVLDALNLTQYRNEYKVTGADLTRGLSLLEPVPKNRSCSEAGIEPHWCSCLTWRNVSSTDPFHQKTALALLEHLNALTESERSRCTERSLKSIEWVMKQAANKKLLSFSKAGDADGYLGKFGAKPKIAKENYQLKIVVGPGRGVYEAMVTYLVKEDKFVIDNRDISRTNAYGDEPRCISDTKPHLNMYCYCKD